MIFFLGNSLFLIFRALYVANWLPLFPWIMQKAILSSDGNGRSLSL